MGSTARNGGKNSEFVSVFQASVGSGVFFIDRKKQFVILNFGMLARELLYYVRSGFTVANWQLDLSHANKVGSSSKKQNAYPHS